MVDVGGSPATSAMVDVGGSPTKSPRPRSRFRNITRVQNRCSFALAQGSPLKTLESADSPSRRASKTSDASDSEIGDAKWQAAFDARLSALEASLDRWSRRAIAAERRETVAVTAAATQERRAVEAEKRFFAQRRRADELEHQRSSPACDGACETARALRRELAALKATLQRNRDHLKDVEAQLIEAKVGHAQSQTDLDHARKAARAPKARDWGAARRRSRSLSLVDILRSPSAALFDDADAAPRHAQVRPPVATPTRTSPSSRLFASAES